MDDMDDAGERIKRFGAFRVAEHWLVVAAFCALAATGFSQMYYELEVSRWIILNLGGLDSARLLHRAAGMAFSALLVFHVLLAMGRMLARRAQPAMLITPKDLRDAMHNIRYYLGIEQSQARAGRYNYKQKFEYWVMLCGGMVMLLTGFVLWFPALAAMFLPGEAIPAAKAVHSNQALLIFAIISVWHIYNAIFSPEVFPLDTTMFSGYISVRRMEAEHPLELEQLRREAGSEEGRFIKQPDR